MDVPEDNEDTAFNIEQTGEPSDASADESDEEDEIHHEGNEENRDEMSTDTGTPPRFYGKSRSPGAKESPTRPSTSGSGQREPSEPSEPSERLNRRVEEEEEEAARRYVLPPTAAPINTAIVLTYTL